MKRQRKPTDSDETVATGGRADETRQLSGTDDGGMALDEISTPMASRLIDRQEIGCGGMGSIRVVEDRALKREAAKKTLRTDLRENQVSQMQFIREARVTGQLEHPNIVPVHHIGVDAAGQLYFTMKLVSGKTLRSLIQELPDGPVEHHQLLNLIDVVIKVCHALAFAHSRGVVHCDVKSANVMVGEFGEVYLMDWGVARSLADATADDDRIKGLSPATCDESEIIGTPSYMSPEQAAGDLDHIDQRSDVFLIGSMIYEILTRRPPYRGTSVFAALIKAVEARFVPPEEVVGAEAVPPELGRIVMKAMAGDRQARYQSIEELQKDLVMFSRGAGEFIRTEVAAGTTIISEGEEGDAAYFIVQGRCQVTTGRGRKRRVLREMGPGETFGETAILSPGPRTATVTAIEDTTLEIVSRPQLERELSAIKPWLAAIIRTLADRFRERETQ
jgi:serine/threonine-protein kinase